MSVSSCLGILFTLVSILGLGSLLGMTAETAEEVDPLAQYQLYEGIPLGGQYAAARDITPRADLVEGVERGINARGVPYIGSLEAPLVLANVLDFKCPHCETNAAILDDVIQDFVYAGDVRLELYLLPLQTHEPESTLAAQSALCAGQQGAFWEFHDELFARDLEGTRFPWEIAEDLGLDVGALLDCMDSPVLDGITAAQELAASYDIFGVPTLLYRPNAADEDVWLTYTINGNSSGIRTYDELQALIYSNIGN